MPIQQALLHEPPPATTAQPGQAEWTSPGTYSWTAPGGVNSVNVVAIDGVVFAFFTAFCTKGCFENALNHA